MLRLVSKPQLTANNYGFVTYCHHCGDYQTFSWRKLNKVGCICKNPAITVSGAMWLGQLHNAQQLERFQALAQQWHWYKIIKLLNLMQGEIDFPPYFYTLGEIGNRGKLDLPKRSHLIKALQDRGYQAAATHISPAGIKTNAQMENIIAIATNI